MNLKELDKAWRESCPEETNGLVKKRNKPKRWTRIIQSAKARKKLKEKK